MQIHAGWKFGLYTAILAFVHDRDVLTGLFLTFWFGTETENLVSKIRTAWKNGISMLVGDRDYLAHNDRDCLAQK